MGTINITRALSEIGTLTERIEKATSNIYPLFMKSKDGVVVHDKMHQRLVAMPQDCTEEESRKEAVAALQSVTDMIDRRARLRNAVMLSNIKTKVTIGGTEMTVAEARMLKDRLTAESKLGQQLSQVYDQHVVMVDNYNNTRLKEMKEKLATFLALKEDEAANAGASLSSPAKEKLEEQYTENYRKQHCLELVDPVDAKTLGKKLQQKYEDYLAEIDYVLGSSNATTTIDVD